MNNGMTFLFLRGKNAVSGKEEAPMLVPASNIAYVTINQDLHVVVILMSGERINTHQTIREMKEQVIVQNIEDMVAKGFPRDLADVKLKGELNNL